MDRRGFHRAAVASLLAVVPGAVRSQSGDKVFRVGFLTNYFPRAELELGTASSYPEVVAFVEGMRALGWHDGKNIRMVWRSAEGRQFERHPGFVDEMVRMPVDVIVGFAEGVDAAASATRTIPIVMGAYEHPVERGLVQSLPRPGRNITGVASSVDPNVLQKSLALLKEAVPRISRVCLVSRAGGPFADRTPDPNDQPRIKAAASALGIAVFHLTYGEGSTIGALLRSAVRQGANAILSDGNYALFHPARVWELMEQEAVRLRLPIMHLSLRAAARGGLMSHGTDEGPRWRRLPRFIDRILRGEKPDTMPIEQLGNPEFHVNLKAARALGLEFPQSVLLQADRVFE